VLDNVSTHTHTVSRGVVGGSTQGPKEGEEQEWPSLYWTKTHTFNAGVRCFNETIPSI